MPQGPQGQISTASVNRTPIIRMGALRGPGPLGCSRFGAGSPPQKMFLAVFFKFPTTCATNPTNLNIIGIFHCISCMFSVRTKRFWIEFVKETKLYDKTQIF